MFRATCGCFRLATGLNPDRNSVYIKWGTLVREVYENGNKHDSTDEKLSLRKHGILYTQKYFSDLLICVEYLKIFEAVRYFTYLSEVQNLARKFSEESYLFKYVRKKKNI